ncbi:hypothetical protein GCM10010421_61510 [Streptomyces glaucus]|uniref:Secreted protein n=1 Tax=Streptomyces glaucus TaxID=284029 RepID=A0ABP5XTI8_9ACTN
MAAAGAVGDPACSLSAVGRPDPALLPGGLARVGVGQAGAYWCLVF